MKRMEYQEAANYWNNKDMDAVKMPRQELLEAMESYIRKNNTCALATGFGTYIRCTPIEYSYLEGSFYLFSEGGQKFVGLEQNDNVCLAIFNKYEGFGKVKGMQVSGKVNIIEPFSNEYNRVAIFKNIPLETLKKLPHPMYLLQVVPERIDFLNSEFKEKGYGSRQAVNF